MRIGTIKLIKQKKVQEVQAELDNGEIRTGLQIFQQYGFTSQPLVDCETLIDNDYIVATEDKDHRFADIKEGEVCLYTHEKDYLHFKKDNKVQLKTKELKADVENKIEIKTKSSQINSEDTIKIETKSTDLNSKDDLKISTKDTDLKSSEKIKIATKSTELNTENELNIKTQKTQLKSDNVNFDSKSLEIKTNKFKVEGSTGELIEILSQLTELTSKIATLVGTGMTPLAPTGTAPLSTASQITELVPQITQIKTKLEGFK